MSDMTTFDNLMSAWKSYLSENDDIDVPMTVLKLYLHAVDWNRLGSADRQDAAIKVIDLFSEDYFRAIMDECSKPDPIEDLDDICHTVRRVF